MVLAKEKENCPHSLAQLMKISSITLLRVGIGIIYIFSETEPEMRLSLLCIYSKPRIYYPLDVSLLCFS